MMTPNYYSGISPVYVRWDSPKMVTIRSLVGRVGQTKRNYIDFPQLLTPKRMRASTFPLLEPTSEQLIEFGPLLEEALRNEVSPSVVASIDPVLNYRNFSY